MAEENSQLLEILRQDSPQALSDLMGKIGVSKNDILANALKMEHLPVNSLDWMRKFMAVDWMLSLTEEQWKQIDMQRAFQWWMTDESRKTTQAVQVFFDYHMWMFQNGMSLDPDSELTQSRIGFASNILQDMSMVCPGPASIMKIFGQESGAKGGLADLGLLYIVNPKTEWPQRFGLSSSQLLCAVIDQPHLSFMAFGDSKDGNYMKLWAEANEENKKALEQLVARYKSDIIEGKDWINTWLPGGTYALSPLKDWTENPQNYNTSPLDHPFIAKSLVGKSIPETSDVREFFSLAFDGDYGKTLNKTFIYQKLGLIAQQINEDATPLIVSTHYPSKLGRDLNANTPNVIHHAAKDPVRAEELRDLLRNDAEQLFIGSLDCREFLQWVKEVPEWLTWKDDDGRNLFYRWHEERKTIEQSYVLKFEDLIQPIVEHLPQWLWQPDNSGTACIDVLIVDETVKADIKRQLLSHFSSLDNTKQDKPRM